MSLRGVIVADQIARDQLLPLGKLREPLFQQPDQFFLIDGFSEKFNITISDDDAKDIKTVGDVVKLLTK